MRYPGGKGKSFQHVINLMPQHRVYIETHLGGGAVMRNKRPAARSIGIELHEKVADRWRKGSIWESEVQPEVYCTSAEAYLSEYRFEGGELVYADPPYHPAVRRQPSVYRHDYSHEDHVRLLALLCSLPCMVIVSGYNNPLYADALSGWNTKTFNAKTHQGVREETLWFNFDEPTQLHDSRFIGDTFRDREASRRRIARLKDKIERMDPRERATVIEWLVGSYGSNNISSYPDRGPRS